MLFIKKSNRKLLRKYLIIILTTDMQIYWIIICVLLNMRMRNPSYLLQFEVNRNHLKKK